MPDTRERSRIPNEATRSTTARRVAVPRPRTRADTVQRRGHRYAGYPHRARRVPDGALPARSARGGAQGGPAPDRDRVRRVGAQRQPGRRGQAEVVLHLLVRPEAARGARRSRETPAAGGARVDRWPVGAQALDRVRARQPRLAVSRRADGRRRAPSQPRRQADRRRRAPRCPSTTGIRSRTARR